MGKNRRRRRRSSNPTDSLHNHDLQNQKPESQLPDNVNEEEDDDDDDFFGELEDEDLELNINDFFANSMEENEEIVKKVYGESFLNDLKKMASSYQDTENKKEEE
jgi:hypothetical protein